MDVLRDDLAALSPSLRVREGGPGDAVDGVVPRLVVSPASTGQVAAVVARAAAHGASLVARGAGTKLDWGRPPEGVEILVELSAMDRVLEHAVGDFVARVEAGTTLDRLGALLAAAGQRLPVEQVVPGSTVGGVIATGLSGPSRHLDGAVRDVLIGLTVVRADGVVARSGSKVVKNVAGYDLAKLFTGSFGTLGIVTEATFRLRPLPRARQVVTCELPDEDDLAAALTALRAAEIAASAIEVDRCVDPGRPAEVGPAGTDGAIRLAVLLEGDERSLTARVAATVAALGHAIGAAGTTAPAPVRTAPGVPSWWAEVPGPVTTKLSCAPGDVPGLLRDLAAWSARHARPLAVRGAAADGVLWAGCPAATEPAAVGALLEVARARCERTGGGAVLLRAPAETKAALDSWGPVRGLDLMRRVKMSFDPGRLLAPGRFVGGI